MGVRARWNGYSGRRRAALAVALLLIAGLIALWLLRKPIAGRYVDRTLAAANVPARYTIADLGLGGQRLTNVVIGDPNAPDLVADWIETQTRLTARGPELTGARAGRLRLRGRLVEGRLSLGAIDRLLPKGDGGPFSLPPLDLAIEDGRLRLETPFGIAGVSLKGSGRLDRGFDGRLALVGERLGTGDCRAERVAGVMAVRTRRASDAGTRLTLDGPLRAGRIACAGATLAGWRSDLTAALTTRERLVWAVQGRVATGRVTHPVVRAEGVGGTFSLTGDRKVLAALDLSANGVAAGGMRARRVSVDGSASNEAGRYGYLGQLLVENADVRGIVPRFDTLAPGTPVAPILSALSASVGAAARNLSGEAQIDASTGPDGPAVDVVSASAQSASGAMAWLSPEGGIRWSRRGMTVDGELSVRGGGLPTLVARSRQVDAAPARVEVRMQPYAAGGARLALGPITIAGGRVVTRATLSGPLPGGRVDGLSVPLDLRFAGGGLVANPDCTPLAFDSLAVSGLRLRAARARLCPTGTALIRVSGGAVAGGARLDATRFAGTLGSTPVAVALGGGTLRLADRGFVLEGVAARLGSPERVTRLDFAQLEGRAGQGIGGTFAGGGGQIANVPLLMSDATGQWRFAGGTLALDGALQVRDAEEESPRFRPTQARDVALTLADNTIRAKAVLHEPTTGTRVADVAIVHALGPGTGTADLAVRDLTFTKSFQPELLTPLTYGVVADVAGTVAGGGHIAWGSAGVTSTGVFRTAGTDLAAAFGPVTGLAGELRFTDLLGLETAPGQVVTLKAVNPGVPVTEGTIRYRLLRNTRVGIEGGEWPFAGGRLLLDPTILDFGAPAERRMTFRVDGVAADRFLQQFDFKNLDATGTFDGVLPMVFDANGGRIEGGSMTVREGGGTIRYVGELTEKDLGFWGDFAFQALKSLQYRSLSVTMNGPLAGEMITDVRFAGVRQGEGAKTNFLIRRLQRLPLVFNIRIKAPFRSLLDSAQGFYDPSRLIRRNLPALIEQQEKAGQATPIQPPASGPVPQEAK